jgi:hypothetical protein
MNECEFHCALCPDKCTLKPGHPGFCNCGGHYDFKNPTQTCGAECDRCYERCVLTGEHDQHRCEDHKKGY